MAGLRLPLSYAALYTFGLPKDILPLVEERSYECRSAHSNPTVVAAQRRTDFVLV